MGARCRVHSARVPPAAAWPEVRRLGGPRYVDALAPPATQMAATAGRQCLHLRCWRAAVAAPVWGLQRGEHVRAT